LKAFLRTEEKKREKDRSSTTPAVATTPAPVANPAAEAHDESTISSSTVTGNVTSSEVRQAETAPAVALDKVANDHENAGEVPTSTQVCHIWLLAIVLSL
jgi:hypothetical protein